jgi:DNA-directed RNA polymerase subunit M
LEFCNNCGIRLKYRQAKLESKTIPVLACDKCGFYIPIKGTISKPEESENKKASIKVVGEAEQDIKTMPTIAMECPKCRNKEAFWWLLQTRGGDEPTTQFYRCVKCGHTWRVYA